MKAGLHLPTLSALVPHTLYSAGDMEHALELGDFLIAVGVLDEEDLLAQRGDQLGAVNAALGRWVRRLCGNLERLTPNFAFRAEYNESGHLDALVLTLTALCERWPIGAAIETLEHDAPGLGPTILAALGAGLPIPLFTPADAFCEVREMYWYGNDNEEEFVSDNATTDAERDEFRESIITRKMFDSAFPDWVLSGAKGWSAVRCRRHARGGGRGAQAADICAELMSLRRRATRKYALHAHDIDDEERCGPFIGYGGLLPWRDIDLTVRVWDDTYNYAMHDEYDDIIFRKRFYANRPQDLTRWLTAARALGREIQLLDRLLRAVSP